MTTTLERDIADRKEKNATEASLTSSTVFLRFVSLRVSSTKLSQRPLQSSGSSEIQELINICQPTVALGGNSIENPSYEYFNICIKIQTPRPHLAQFDIRKKMHIKFF